MPDAGILALLAEFGGKGSRTTEIRTETKRVTRLRADPASQTSYSAALS